MAKLNIKNFSNRVLDGQIQAQNRKLEPLIDKKKLSGDEKKIMGEIQDYLKKLEEEKTQRK